MPIEEFPAETLVVFHEGNGRLRRRVYRRKRTDAPGQQERRDRLALGQRWCRGCREWLPAAEVDARGACRPCINAEYRAAYATNPRAIRARARARKRAVAVLPPVGADLLLEQFEGACAYCRSAATTWDHIVPVKQGGDTVPGNVAPACGNCNSSKKDSPVFEWLRKTGRTPNPHLFDVLMLLEVA